MPTHRLVMINIYEAENRWEEASERKGRKSRKQMRKGKIRGAVRRKGVGELFMLCERCSISMIITDIEM